VARGIVGKSARWYTGKHTSRTVCVTRRAVSNSARAASGTTAIAQGVLSLELDSKCRLLNEPSKKAKKIKNKLRMRHSTTIGRKAHRRGHLTKSPATFAHACHLRPCISMNVVTLDPRRIFPPACGIYTSIPVYFGRRGEIFKKACDHIKAGERRPTR
jgi:hypothetical protein